MATDDATDLFMVFIKDGNPLKAPSRTQFQPKGISTRLLKDVKPGFVFEINKFTFGAGVLDDEKGDDDGSGDTGSGNGGGSAGNGGGTGKQGACRCFSCVNFAGSGAAAAKSKTAAAKNKPPKHIMASSTPLATKGSYPSFRSGKAHAYPVDLHPVTFTRNIDSVSSTLMQNCIDCEDLRPRHPPQAQGGRQAGGWRAVSAA